MVKGEGYERPATRKDAHPSETIMQQICSGERFHLHRHPRAEPGRGIPKKLFFFFRCREQRQQNNKSFVPTSPGVARDSFFFFFYLFILFILLFQFRYFPLKTPAHDDCQSPLPGQVDDYQSPLPGQVGPGLTV